MDTTSRWERKNSAIMFLEKTSFNISTTFMDFRRAPNTYQQGDGESYPLELVYPKCFAYKGNFLRIFHIMYFLN